MQGHVRLATTARTASRDRRRARRQRWAASARCAAGDVHPPPPRGSRGPAALRARPEGQAVLRRRWRGSALALALALMAVTFASALASALAALRSERAA